MSKYILGLFATFLIFANLNSMELSKARLLETTYEASDQKIKTILKNGGIDTEKEWDILLEKYILQNEVRILTEKKFPRGFLEDVQKLSEKIKQFFIDLSKEENPTNKSLEKSINLNFIFKSASEDYYKTNIKNIQDIFKGIGIIIAYQFDKKYLSSRLRTNSDGIFSEPFCPVVIFPAKKALEPKANKIIEELILQANQLENEETQDDFKFKKLTSSALSLLRIFSSVFKRFTMPIESTKQF